MNLDSPKHIDIANPYEVYNQFLGNDFGEGDVRDLYLSFQAAMRAMRHTYGDEYSDLLETACQRDVDNVSFIKQLDEDSVYGCC